MGGWLTNRIAILSEAVHDPGDPILLGVAWRFERLSQRRRAPRDTSALGVLAPGELITAVVEILFVLWSTDGKLMDPQPANALGMMVLAVIGLAFEGAAAVLRVRKGSSLTEKSQACPARRDARVGGVTDGRRAMAIWEIPSRDSLLSIGISLFVLWNVLRMLHKFVGIFLMRARWAANGVRAGYDCAKPQLRYRVPALPRRQDDGQVRGSGHRLRSRLRADGPRHQPSQRELEGDVRALRGDLPEVRGRMLQPRHGALPALYQGLRAAPRNAAR